MAVHGRFPRRTQTARAAARIRPANRIRRALRGAAVVLCVGLVAGVGLPSAPTQAVADGLEVVAAPVVIETLDVAIDVSDPALLAEVEEIHDSFVPGNTRTVVGLSAALADPTVASVGSFTASSGSGITVSFDSSNPSPSNVQAVVYAAVGKWNEALATNPAGPINVAFIWSNMAPGLLGSAGPSALYAHPSLPTPDLYPSALANTLLGTDLNGSNPELVVNLNADVNWYIGTSGGPASGQLDLYSVVLHELAHGLGFLGSGRLLSGSSDPVLGYPQYDSTTKYFVYDKLVTYNDSFLVDTANPAGLLRSNNLFIDLSASYQSKLYAPFTWYDGSSFSHFDEATYPSGWPGALMTPSFGSQQVERDLDGPTLGVMAGIGWPMDARAITPAITGTSSSSGAISVGWGLDLSHVGLAPDGFRLEAWRNGSVLDASLNVNGGTSSATLSGLHSDNTYLVKVVPHAKGIDGTAATASLVVVGGAPAAPTMIRFSGGGLTRTIAWNAPLSSGITGYTVERSSDGQNWSAVGSTASLSIDATFPAGIHQVRVRATNNHGPGKWGHSIPTGISAGVVRPVALDGQISRLYRAYFRRDPDASGFYFWQSQRAGGLALAGASSAFAASDEFASTYGNLSNEAFVDLVYQNVLGRPTDPEGRSFWLSQLAAGASRGAVMTGFSESAEMVASTGTAAPGSVSEAEIYRLYVAFFLRIPDQAGFRYWVDTRNGGASLESIAAAFAGSAEFMTTYGSLSGDRFVELVYGNVLGRAPDGDGAAYWQNRLAGGLGRGALMVGFSDSTEFVIATGTLR